MSKTDERALRERVGEAYARQEAQQPAPPFGVMWARAENARRRPWAGPQLAGLAAAGVAALAVALFWPRPESEELDAFTLALTTDVGWQSPTDVLLELAPAEEPLGTLPQIQFPEPAIEWPVSEERS